MRRLILVVLLSLCAVPAFAQQNSPNQMKLAKDTSFIDRVTYSLVQQALVSKDEERIFKTNGTNPSACTNLPANCHDTRAQFAARVLANSSALADSARLVANAVVGQANLLPPNATTSIDGGTGVATTTATDAAIFATISALWNALAGVY